MQVLMRDKQLFTKKGRVLSPAFFICENLFLENLYQNLSRLSSFLRSDDSSFFHDIDEAGSTREADSEFSLEHGC